jgi:membrane protease YdiL (CAAX protease family)
MRADACTPSAPEDTMTAAAITPATAIPRRVQLAGLLAAAGVLFFVVPLPAWSDPILIDCLGLAACTVAALVLRLPSAIRTLLYVNAVFAVSVVGGRLGWGSAVTTTLIVVIPVLALKAADHNSLLRPTLSWLTRGTLTRGSLVLLVAIVVLSALALILWAANTHPKAPSYLQGLQHDPKIVMVLGVLGFALVNPLWEETFFRGVVLTELKEPWGVLPALVFQAVTFGLAHVNGFPSGVAGAALAGGWGLALGVIRLQTRGILWSYLAHICADATIAFIAVAMLH